MSKPLKVYVVKLTTQTRVTLPPNRSRTTIGVGEEVRMTIEPASAPTSWSMSGGGSLTSLVGTANTYTAGDVAGFPVVTATIKSVSLPTTFNVIAPVVLRMENTGVPANSTSPLWIDHEVLTYVGPDTVNFYNCVFIEGVCYASADGYLYYLDRLKHEPSPELIGVASWEQGKGCLLVGTDRLSGGARDSNYSTGTFVWPIPQFYMVNHGEHNDMSDPTPFTQTDQDINLGVASGKAALELSKAGSTMQVTTTYP